MTTYEPGEFVPVPGEPRSTDPLHETLQLHIAQCKQCNNAVKAGPARGFGQKSLMCSEYFELVKFFGKGILL